MDNSHTFGIRRTGYSFDTFRILRETAQCYYVVTREWSMRAPSKTWGSRERRIYKNEIDALAPSEEEMDRRVEAAKAAHASFEAAEREARNNLQATLRKRDQAVLAALRAEQSQ